MGLNRKMFATIIAAIGAGLVVYGVSVIYWPAGTILCGLLLVAAGLFTDVGGE